MISNRFIFHNALFLLLLGAPALTQAQNLGSAMLYGVVKGARQSQEVTNQISRQMMLKISRDLARTNSNPSATPPFKLDSVLVGLGGKQLPKLVELPKDWKLPDIFNVCVYVDCLVIQDDALWDKKASLLCSRLATRYPKTSEEQWREYLDNGRSQGNRRLELVPELRKYWLDYLVGEGEVLFGEEDGLFWYRLEE